MLASALRHDDGGDAELTVIGDLVGHLVERHERVEDGVEHAAIVRRRHSMRRRVCCQATLVIGLALQSRYGSIQSSLGAQADVMGRAKVYIGAQNGRLSRQFLRAEEFAQKAEEKWRTRWRGTERKMGGSFPVEGFGKLPTHARP